MMMSTEEGNMTKLTCNPTLVASVTFPPRNSRPNIAIICPPVSFSINSWKYKERLLCATTYLEVGASSNNLNDES